MTCSNCGGERLALVALPEVGSIGVHLCLGCGASWAADGAPD